MSDNRQSNSTASRRTFVKAASGIAGSLAVPDLATSARAQEAPYEGYLSDVSNFEGATVDMTGRDEVTITVGAQGNGGAFAFGPAAIKVDPGTTVVWEWTGKGGQHNVVHEGGDFESELVAKQEFTFERTFDEASVRKYFCRPHKSLGMKGVVAVGDTAEGEVVTPSSGAETEKEGQSTGSPDFGGYLDDVGNYEGTVVDARGRDTVSVSVGAQGNGGAFAFDPPAVHVDNKTTVVWEWTGEGGQHNVVHEGGDFKSELTAEAGFTFEQTFESDGIYNYYCQPHKTMGMKGSVVVGDDYPTAADGGTVASNGAGDSEASGNDGNGWGVTLPKGPKHELFLTVFSLLWLAAIIASIPEIIALSRVSSNAVAKTGSRLHAFNAFRSRPITSTLVGWLTVSVVLAFGAALVVGLWLVSGSPFIFLGALATLIGIVALYAAVSTGGQHGRATAGSGGSRNRSGTNGTVSGWVAQGNPNGLKVSRTVDIIRGWFGVTVLFVTGAVIAIALWELSGGGSVFLSVVGLAAILVAAYLRDSVR